MEASLVVKSEFGKRSEEEGCKKEMTPKRLAVGENIVILEPDRSGGYDRFEKKKKTARERMGGGGGVGGGGGLGT